MARLEDICLNVLTNPCEINSFHEKSLDLDFSLCCFIDEFLLMVDRNAFWSVNVQSEILQWNLIIFVTGVCFTRTLARLDVNLID